MTVATNLSGKDASLVRGKDDLQKTVTVSETLGVHEQKVIAVLPATGTVTITLPSVAEAEGQSFSIRCVDPNTGSGDITVEDQNDGITDYTSDSITAGGDGVELHCTNGRYLEWWELTT